MKRAPKKLLNKFQEFLKNTKILLIDEISMVGRQMMGRLDSRFRQGCAGADNANSDLGGLSCICVGDPAQCEALFDQQIYDQDVHKDTRKEAVSEAAVLSNNGMRIYSGFNDVIILSTVHRLRMISKDNLSPEAISYNERARQFMETMHLLRDLKWTLKDYYWLCKRKRSNLLPSERALFSNAPVIMGFSPRNR